MINKNPILLFRTLDQMGDNFSHQNDEEGKIIHDINNQPAFRVSSTMITKTREAADSVEHSE